MTSPIPFVFVDTLTAVVECIDKLSNRQEDFPSVFLDLEGNNLSRRGTVSLLTLLIHPEGLVYLIDLTKLGIAAFTTETPAETSLKDILESPKIVKVFFDIRNDSDALFSHFQIRVDGIHDLQLMELATRDFPRRHVNGLAKCIERDAGLDFVERLKWQRIKEEGTRLFAPEKGGNYAVFDKRPLSNEIATYCIQDVTFLPTLWKIYGGKVNKAWWVKVEDATRERILLSQSAFFNGKGQHMALAPVGWLTWRPIRSTLLQFPNAHTDMKFVATAPIKSSKAETKPGVASHSFLSSTQDEATRTTKHSFLRQPSALTNSENTIVNAMASVKLDDERSSETRHGILSEYASEDQAGSRDITKSEGS